MSGGPTIVVKFGDSVAADSLFLVELDDTLNTNIPEGKVLHRYIYSGVTYFVMYYGPGDIRTLPAAGIKSQFNPGDPTYFLLHYDPTKLRVADIKTTSGTVTKQGIVKRNETDELFFTSTEATQTLSHIPVASLSDSWFGRSPILSRSGLQLELGERIPLHYSMAKLRCFLSPHMRCRQMNDRK